ncbi:MAG: hypothetical protein ACN4G0_12325 [Polyangiales bacterium]
MLVRTYLPLFLLTIFGAAACSDSGGTAVYVPATDLEGVCQTPLAPNEPLCSQALGDDVWSASHRASYAQGSSPFAGPTEGTMARSEHLELDGAGVPVILSFSAPYADGGRAAWSTVTGLDNPIMKIDHQTFEIIDTYIPTEREEDPPFIKLGVSGAYTAIDSQGRFVVGRTRFVSFFRDSVEGDRSSPIELDKRIFIPDELFCNEEDAIAGMTLTYDGQLAFATELGNLFVIPSDVDSDDLGAIPVVSANANCETDEIEDLEIVSNSVASDESGGIYMVTSEAMYRFDWDGVSLAEAWRAEYDSSPEPPSPIRLGPGSGATPSLMGTNVDDDRFVVITDGEAVMSLVLFWRDEIPEGWEPIAPGKDPRIACEIPVLFGDPSTTLSVSEQSVAVRGYSAVVVSNVLTDPTVNPPSGFALAGLAQNLVSALEGGIPEKAPFGLERIDWDPETRSCTSVWSNSEISVPNGIPSISEAAQLVYGLGQRDGQWGLEGLDFATGASKVWVEAGPGTCPPSLAEVASILPGAAAVLAEVPDSCENSAYSATTIGPDGMVYSGTIAGVSRYIPESTRRLPALARADAGIGQGLDLLDRTETADPSGPISQRDHLARALVQGVASAQASKEAGRDAATVALNAAMRSLDDAVASLDAGGAITEQLAEARASLISAREAL